LWWLLVVMMVTSGIGLFYYLRVIVAMFMEPPAEPVEAPGTGPVPLIARLTLGTLTILLVWFGLYPGPLMALIRTAVTRVG
jgi:NADH-quinone oxidoreductase subunit N